MSAILNVLAIGGAVGGSTMFAMANPSLIPLAYVFYLTGSLASVPIQMKHRSQRGLLALSGYFTVINIIGFIHWTSRTPT